MMEVYLAHWRVGTLVQLKAEKKADLMVVQLAVMLVYATWD